MRKIILFFIIFILLGTQASGDRIKYSGPGEGYYNSIYLKLDQTVPQTVTASPVLDWGTADYIPKWSATKTLAPTSLSHEDFFNTVTLNAGATGQLLIDADSVTHQRTAGALVVRQEATLGNSYAATISQNTIATTGKNFTTLGITGGSGAAITGDNSSVIGGRIQVEKIGADTSAGTYDLLGVWNYASNTGSTNTGTKNTYGGYFSGIGDTAGASTAYGIYATATGADTNYAGYFVGDLVGTGTGTFLDVTLTDNILNTPPYTTLGDWMNNTQSSGFFCDGFIQDRTPPDGTIDVSAGEGFIRAEESECGVVYFFEWATVEGLELTNNATNYIYIDYNAGTPIVLATIDPLVINTYTNFRLGYVYRKDTELHIVNAGTSLTNIPQKNYARLREIYGFQRASGMMISEVGERYLAVTAGVLYEGLNRLITSAFDSSGVDRFVYWYRDGIGGWVEVNDQAQVSNTHWDNDSGTLELLSKDFYAANWVYLDYEGHIHILYPQFEAKKLSDVEAKIPPTDIPPLVRDFCFLIAKVIVQEAIVNIISISYPFLTPFSTSGIIYHNETAGLQGGIIDEYYHLTSDEYGGDWGSKDLLTTGTLTADVLFDGTLTITDGNLSTTGTGRFDGGVSIGDALPSGANIYVFDVTVASAETHFGFYPLLASASGGATLYGFYSDINSGGAADHLFGLYSGVAADSADDEAYALYASVSGAADPSEFQVAGFFNNSIAGTDTNNKKWAIYNASTNTTAGKIFLGIDNVKTYWGTGYDASIYYDGTNFVINPQEVGTGYLSVLGDITTTGKGTLGALKLSTLPPIYANNAAAIVGGLVAGDFYRSGGDPDILYIVH